MLTYRVCRIFSIACRQRPAISRQRQIPVLARPFSSTPTTLAKPTPTNTPKNKEIPYDNVTIISATGENLGVHPLSKALFLFDKKTHDLLLVNTRSTPPICRITPHTTEKKDSQPHFIKPPKNDKIPHDKIIAKSESNELLGTYSLEDALKLFNHKTHDLILSSPPASSTDLPICHIVSHEYQQKQKAAARANKHPKPNKNSKTTLKELKVSSNISTHDLEIKLAKARELLEHKHQVRFTIEDKRNGKSRELFKLIVEGVKDDGTLMGEPTGKGRELLATFSPGKGGAGKGAKAKA